jgi:hypothetical protein
MGSVTGGEVVARMLATEGVEVVFGIIDGSYFGLYSASTRASGSTGSGSSRRVTRAAPRTWRVPTRG